MSAVVNPKFDIRSIVRRRTSVSSVDTVGGEAAASGAGRHPIGGNGQNLRSSCSVLKDRERTIAVHRVVNLEQV